MNNGISTEMTMGAVFEIEVFVCVCEHFAVNN